MLGHTGSRLGQIGRADLWRADILGITRLELVECLRGVQRRGSTVGSKRRAMTRSHRQGCKGGHARAKHLTAGSTYGRGVRGLVRKVTNLAHRNRS